MKVNLQEYLIQSRQDYRKPKDPDYMTLWKQFIGSFFRYLMCQHKKDRILNQDFGKMIIGLVDCLKQFPYLPWYL